MTKYDGVVTLREVVKVLHEIKELLEDLVWDDEVAEDAATPREVRGEDAREPLPASGGAVSEGASSSSPSWQGATWDWYDDVWARRRTEEEQVNLDVVPLVKRYYEGRG